MDELVALAAQLDPDELEVLIWIARRLIGGRKVYGELRLLDDPRDFRRERAEELADALVYSACAELVCFASGARPGRAAQRKTRRGARTPGALAQRKDDSMSSDNVATPSGTAKGARR